MFVSLSQDGRKMSKPTTLETGHHIADLCQQRLGDEFRVVMSKTETMQWDVFVTGYLTKAGGFAFE